VNPASQPAVRPDVKKVLIVSPHFPPINAPDMQRIRMSLPYYRSHGWEPVVLAVGERWQRGVFEPELLATVPADIRVVRTRALSPRWTRFLGVGNLGLRAWMSLFREGSRLLEGEKFDLVFISNTQFMTFTLGRLWRRRFKVPYVLDVQDPWRTDFYERAGLRPPGGWKYEFARLSAWIFEGWSFERAAGIISVSPSYLADLGARYPWFSAKPGAVIRFGASAADLDRAKKLPRPDFRLQGTASTVYYLYTGASGPVMPHAVSALFTALRSYRERFPERAGRLKFYFVGTSYVEAGRGKPSVVPLAEEFGVSDQVVEVPHRIGFMEALRLQLDADVLMLPGSSDPAYSPSKVYLYYLTNRPILGLVFRGSVMEGLLEELSCARLVRIPEPGGEGAAQAAIHSFFDHSLSGFPAGSLPVRNDAYFASHFLADALTGEQCALFDEAVRFESVADDL
jgi:hypothetical protein